MTKRSLIFLAFAVSIVTLVYTIFLIGSKDAYKVEAFKSSEGWGYQISENDKIIISQPYIPCISENKPFPSEKLALEIGKLVLLKVENNEDPSITIEELNSKFNTCNN